MVAVPIVVEPPVLLASKLKVSPSSRLASLAIATRTNNLAGSPVFASPFDGITTLPVVPMT